MGAVTGGAGPKSQPSHATGRRISRRRLKFQISCRPFSFLLDCAESIFLRINQPLSLLQRIQPSSGSVKPLRLSASLRIAPPHNDSIADTLTDFEVLRFPFVVCHGHSDELGNEETEDKRHQHCPKQVLNEFHIRSPQVQNTRLDRTHCNFSMNWYGLSDWYFDLMVFWLIG
ncbi:hypothetical protein RchiOBHm_Chr5g0060331 [Rosa chinensis]|uniref:Uncharacterized protein n=1 Tax=Rosa chinensis TaxID=74649 RepID=A0A2P6QHN0_ROSCH|nr:hypothetical protein RchiOBHm_Chr5g0060331 [Rosa chinensis]